MDRHSQGEASVSLALTRRTFIGVGAATLASLAAGTGIARADRFGPPYMGIVAASNATVHQQADPGSPSVGTLANGSHVVVMGTGTAADGSTWTRLPEGWVPSNQVVESIDEWVAEVSSPSAINVYAEPAARSGIRRDANPGDLLRVTGVSAGVNGDEYVWWATSEGYVHLGTLRQGTSTWAQQWTLPNAGDALRGWWATFSSDANVRAGATTQAPVVGSLGPGNNVKVIGQAQGENVQGSATWYRIDGGRYAGAWVHSSLIAKIAPPRPSTAPPPTMPANGTWIVVSKSASTLTVVQNGQPIFVTYTSLGVSGRQTPNGVYGTYLKFWADRMTSRTVKDALNAYDLPNVPFVMYYDGTGAAIHGAYWHDVFGAPHSEGCINLTWGDSAYVFAVSQPTLAPNAESAQAQPGQATPVVIVG